MVPSDWSKGLQAASPRPDPATVGRRLADPRFPWSSRARPPALAPVAERPGRGKEVVPALDPVKVCPRYEQAVQILGKKWTGLILRVLMSGKKRFCDFKASLPEMSDRILSERLKELEEAGILTRHVHDTRPVLIEYELTEKGRALEPVVAAIQAWADRWCDDIPDSHPVDEGGEPAEAEAASREGQAAGEAASPP